MNDGIFSGITGFCWGLFLLVWVVGAIYNYFKAPPVQKRKVSLYWWPVIILLFLLLWGATHLVPYSFHTFWQFLTFNAIWLKIVGAVCLLVSTAFTLWARWVLGTMWTSAAIIKEGHQLRIEGPYHITRNPIYTGLLGMLFGTVLIYGIGVLLPVLVVSFLMLEIKIFLEEPLLLEKFGEEYIQYKRHVPQLIPSLKWPTARQ